MGIREGNIGAGMYTLDPSDHWGLSQAVVHQPMQSSDIEQMDQQESY